MDKATRDIKFIHKYYSFASSCEADGCFQEALELLNKGIELNKYLLLA